MSWRRRCLPLFRFKSRIPLCLLLLVLVVFLLHRLRRGVETVPDVVLARKDLLEAARRDESRQYWIVDDLSTQFPFLRSFASANPGDDKDSNGPSVVTLTTQSSLSNLPHLVRLSARWRGDVSVAVFAPSDSDVAATLAVLRLLSICRREIRQRFRFHLIFPELVMDLGPASYSIPKLESIVPCGSELDRGLRSLHPSKTNYAFVEDRSRKPVLYPVNLLRNVAIVNAQSEYVFLVDVDMIPSSGLDRRFQEFLSRRETQRGEHEGGFEMGLAAAALLRLRTKAKVAFVVPAYEFNDAVVGGVSDRIPLPSTKTQLMKLGDDLVRPFYSQVCHKCQKNTDYARWESMPELESDVAFTRAWLDPWEPFYIAKKAEMPLYDERFKQYGFNRIQQVCEMHVAGFEFHVMNNFFLLHSGFKSLDRFHEEKRRENDANRNLFRKFKQELKMKYPTTNRRCY